MPEPRYIQAILPLKLGWLPTYRLREDQNPKVGDRILVRLAGKTYLAVVARVGVTPGEKLNSAKISEVESVPDLPSVSEEELKLWEFVSEYYLCTLGEVYRAAFGASGISSRDADCSSPRRARKHLENSPIRQRPSLSAGSKQALTEILEYFQERKPVLLRSDDAREDVFAELERRTREQGRDVLILRPELKETDGPLRYDASTSPATKRELAKLLREHPGQTVYGTRNSLFLPWRNLGLLIVDDEFSHDYKQDGVSPRFNARDTALVLAAIHGADALLCASMPSLESAYNCRTGRFAAVQMPSGGSLIPEIVDTSAEKRKRGMDGSYSLILLSRMKSVLDAGGRVLILQPWKDTSDAEIEARVHFPKAGARINAMPLWKAGVRDLAKYDLTVLMNADFLLAKQDFRADENACRELDRLKRGCMSLLVQTSRADHPAFGAEDPCGKMLAERRNFGLPPYTREIRLINGDEVKTVYLPKDKELAARKAQLLKEAGSGTVIDVDPK